MNPLRQILQSTALLGLAALGALASGQTQGFVQKTRTVHAGVLLLDGDKPTGNYTFGQTAAPFAFYNLDQATSIKPDGWSFSNPYAPGVVTNDIVARYQELGLSGNALPTVGSTISKNDGPYWSVRLSDLSETQIEGYDVLLIAVRNNLSLNPLERERLRRFVDGGGVLWVDVLDAGSPGSDNLPVALQRIAGSAGVIYRDGTSPVLTGPRQVTDGDLSFLNALQFNSTFWSVGQLATNLNNDAGLIADFSRYHGVVFDGGSKPTMVEARIGDGAIVVTSRGAAELLNQGAATAVTGGYPTENVGYQGQTPTLGAGGRAAGRLAVNIVALGGDYRQANGGARKTSAAAADPGSPVLSRFNAEGNYGPPSNPVTGVPNAFNGTVTYKGYLVATVGSRIVVFDAVPGRDLDGDGDPDDGIYKSDGTIDPALRDASVGKPYDVVWVSGDLGSTLGVPVCAEVPEATGTAATTDQVLVTDANGNLHVFALEQHVGGNLNGGLIGGVHTEVTPSGGITPPGGGANYVNGPIAPTVIDGFAYMADAQSGASGSQGRVWVVDLSAMTRLHTAGGGHDDWYVGGTAVNGNPLPGFTATPTIGYIPIGDSSGGVDRVLYAPGVSGTSFQPGLASIWIGAKGESPYTWDADGTTLTITTRAGAAGQLPIYTPSGTSPAERELAPHLSFVDTNGNPISATVWSNGDAPFYNVSGVLKYKTTFQKSDFTAANVSPRIDYTIDWGDNPVGLSANITRGQILLPVRQTPTVDTTQRILGPIALTTRGTLHMVEATPGANTGGSYFAMREDAGRGQFRTISRFTLYNSYSETFGTGIGGTAVREVLEDVDNVLQAAGLSPGNLSGFNFAGGVAVRNGIVFAPINATRSLGSGSPIQIPVTMVAAFRAEPETAQLKIGTSLGTNPRLTQTDFGRSSITASALQQPMQSTLAGASLTYDADNGIIRVENLASVTHGAMQDCLSESQPVGVGSDTQATAFRQPDAFGDNWSPLLWFALWNGGTTSGVPLVAGNEVFLPVNTFLPAILNGTFNPANIALSQSGVIFSVDADAPTSGSYETPLADRPWIVQQAQIQNNGTFSASPYFRMPQVRGVSSFADYVVRLNQTQIGSSNAIYGVGGGGGVVAAWGSNGVYGLSQADFLVCDEGRLLRVDSAGNAVATAFADRFSGIGNGGGASITRPLVRPVKAYPIGTGQTLVVDAGGNKVVKMDADGTALRTIDRIHLDPNHKPAAYRINEPLGLNDPRDATTYEGYVQKGATEIVTNQQPVEYWTRTIIADSGNHRIVELADRFTVNAQGQIGAPITVSEYDPETNTTLDVAQVGVLVWQSPSLQQAATTGELYNSISRVFIGSATTGRYVYVTGVSRARTTRSAAGLDNPNATPTATGVGGGAVVVFDPAGGTRVFDRFGMPDLTNVSFLADPTNGTFNTNTRANRPAQNDRPFTGVQAVSTGTVVSNGAASVRVMVTDEDAVYEFVIDSAILGDATQDPTRNSTGTGSLQPVWMINEAAYTAIHGTPGSSYLPGNPRFFRPAYARRLESGEVLVVNGYRGLMRDLATTYSGEVVTLDGTPNVTNSIARNLGFTLSSVRFELPPLTGIRGLVGPVFADRR